MLKRRVLNELVKRSTGSNNFFSAKNNISNSTNSLVLSYNWYVFASPDDVNRMLGTAHPDAKIERLV